MEHVPEGEPDGLGPFIHDIAATLGFWFLVGVVVATIAVAAVVYFHG